MIRVRCVVTCTTMALKTALRKRLPRHPNHKVLLRYEYRVDTTLHSPQKTEQVCVALARKALASLQA